MKQGEITTQQIVILVILITSFAIVLFFLFRLNLGEETDKELCRNSVLLRGNSILPKDSIPLNCRRSYVCLTSDGTCEKMSNPDLKKIKTKEETYKVLADEMADCWWMFGEGKVNYVGDDLTKNNYCSICSQIAFDNSLKEKIFDNKDLDKREFHKFLANKKISGGDITYLEYLYGTKTKLDVNSNANFGEVNLNNQHLIMMGIKSQVSKIGWVLGGVSAGILTAGVAAGVFFTAPISVPTLLGAIVVGGTVGGAGGSLVAVTVEGLSGEEYLSPTIIEVKSKEFEALNCKDILTFT